MFLKRIFETYQGIAQVLFETEKTRLKIFEASSDEIQDKEEWKIISEKKFNSTIILPVSLQEFNSSIKDELLSSKNSRLQRFQVSRPSPFQFISYGSIENHFAFTVYNENRISKK